MFLQIRKNILKETQNEFPQQGVVSKKQSRIPIEVIKEYILWFFFCLQESEGKAHSAALLLSAPYLNQKKEYHWTPDAGNSSGWKAADMPHRSNKISLIEPMLEPQRVVDIQGWLLSLWYFSISVGGCVEIFFFMKQTPDLSAKYIIVPVLIKSSGGLIPSWQRRSVYLQSYLHLFVCK